MDMLFFSHFYSVDFHPESWLPFSMYDVYWLFILAFNVVFIIILFAIPIQLILILTHQDRHQGLVKLVQTIGLAALFYGISVWYDFPLLNTTVIQHFNTGIGPDDLITQFPMMKHFWAA